MPALCGGAVRVSQVPPARGRKATDAKLEPAHHLSIYLSLLIKPNVSACASSSRPSAGAHPFGKRLGDATRRGPIVLEREACEAIDGQSQVLVGVLLVHHAARWRRAVAEHLRDRVPQREARQARALRQGVEVPFEQEVVRPAEHTCRAWQDEWPWRCCNSAAARAMCAALGPSHRT